MSKFDLVLHIGVIVLSLAIATVAMIKMYRSKKVYLRRRRSQIAVENRKFIEQPTRPTQPYWSTDLVSGKTLWRCPCTPSEYEKGTDWSCDPTIKTCRNCGSGRPDRRREPSSARSRPYWSMSTCGFNLEKVWRCPCTPSKIEEGKDWSCGLSIEKCGNCGAKRPLERRKEPSGA